MAVDASYVSKIRWCLNVSSRGSPNAGGCTRRYAELLVQATSAGRMPRLTCPRIHQILHSTIRVECFIDGELNSAAAAATLYYSISASGQVGYSAQSPWAHPEKRWYGCDRLGSSTVLCGILPPPPPSCRACCSIPHKVHGTAGRWGGGGGGANAHWHILF